MDGIDYFAPYIPGKGVCDLYEVGGIHTSTKIKGNDDDKLRITFDLKYLRPLFSDYRILHTPFVQYTYIDTMIDKLLS